MTRVRTLRVTIEPSARLLRAGAAFGLVVRRARGVVPAPRRLTRAAEYLDRRLPASGIAVVLGASGTGKSTLLHELARRLQRRGAPFGWVVPGRGARALIDSVPGRLEDALRALARAGLADAMLLGRRGSELSDGERFRLALAIALARSRAGATLLCDEFTSGLDRPTARCVCAGLRRWAANARCRFVCASVHEDTPRMLRPDAAVVCDEDKVWVGSRGNSQWIADD